MHLIRLLPALLLPFVATQVWATLSNDPGCGPRNFSVTMGDCPAVRNVPVSVIPYGVATLHATGCQPISSSNVFVELTGYTVGSSWLAQTNYDPSNPQDEIQFGYYESEQSFVNAFARLQEGAEFEFRVEVSCVDPGGMPPDARCERCWGKLKVVCHLAQPAVAPPSLPVTTIAPEDSRPASASPDLQSVSIDVMAPLTSTAGFAAGDDAPQPDDAATATASILSPSDAEVIPSAASDPLPSAILPSDDAPAAGVEEAPEAAAQSASHDSLSDANTQHVQSAATARAPPSAVIPILLSFVGFLTGLAHTR